MEPGDQQASVLDALREIQRTQSLLVNAVESLSGKSIDDAAGSNGDLTANSIYVQDSRNEADESESPSVESPLESADKLKAPAPPTPSQRQGFTSRIILTTYPKQIGIKPLPMDWGNSDPLKRGPIVVSRAASTIRRRNAVGAHGGSYSIYYALAVASNELNSDHRPDFTNTEPAAKIGPFPQWGDPGKIVAMDPWGHLAPWIFKDTIEKDNVDIRPTIAITKAHMKLPELAESVKAGRLVPDGKVCLNEQGELAVTKFAVEPVWYLPGVAERFGIDEATLRRSLFEHTGGSYPELITRGDIKVFLPPIGGLTVYCFGDPAKMSDESVRLSLRIHDECNGSDVFGSDICTCRPYLIFGIEEAVKEAQNGGSGVVIYFRKEGRALGEVTKYLVYNARKRGADRASDYFKKMDTSKFLGIVFLIGVCGVSASRNCTIDDIKKIQDCDPFNFERLGKRATAEDFKRVCESIHQKIDCFGDAKTCFTQARFGNGHDQGVFMFGMYDDMCSDPAFEIISSDFDCFYKLTRTCMRNPNCDMSACGEKGKCIMENMMELSKIQEEKCHPFPLSCKDYPVPSKKC